MPNGFNINARTGANARKEESIFRYIDWFTVILYLLLVTAGVISIYAASYDFDNASIFSFEEFSGKQIRWIGLSFLLGLVLIVVDARMYETYAYPIYLAMLLLLVVTIFIAPDIKGSRSWLVHLICRICKIRHGSRFGQVVQRL